MSSDRVYTKPEEPVVKKNRRQRQVLVCTNCRRRKIKCDKGKPCLNCVHGNLRHSCMYETPHIKVPNEQYSMELQLELGKNNNILHRTSSSAPKAYISQFSLSDTVPSEQQALKRHRSSDLSSGDSGKNTTASDQSVITPPTQADSASVPDAKSELNILRARLEMLEKSLASASGPPSVGPTSVGPPPVGPRAYPDAVSPPQSTPSILYPDFKDPRLTTGMPFTPGTYNPNGTGVPYGEFGAGLQAPSPGFPQFLQQIKPPGLPESAQQNLKGPGFVQTPIGENSKLPPLRHSVMNAPSTFTNTVPTPQAPSSLSGSSTFTPVHLQSPHEHSDDMKNYLLIGTNIFGNINDRMNFYSDYTSVHWKDNCRRINFGPFAWSSHMRRDKGLHLVWNFIRNKNENSKALIFGSSAPESSQANGSRENEGVQSAEQFENGALEVDGDEGTIPYSKILKAREERNRKKQILKTMTLPLGLSYYDVQINRELDTIEKIKAVLPKKKVLWMLVDRFFAYIYAYMPYLDEEYFKRDITSIVGPVSYAEENITEVKIENKMDLATVGILLAVLRICYLSLFSNNVELNEKIINSETGDCGEAKEMRYLILNPIQFDTIHVANLCYEQFQYFRRANLYVIQLALYLKIHHTYAPEDGDGADGGSARVSMGTLLQMSYQLGLNREPDETQTDLRINNLSRKIWAHICLTDTYNAYTYGNPMTVDPIYFDTKFPFHVPGGENLIDKEKDRTFFDRFTDCMDIGYHIKILLRLSLDVNAHTALAELTSMISHLESAFYNRFGCVRDCLDIKGCSPEDLVDRNAKVTTMLGLKGFLMSMFFHIYLFYEPKDIKISFFYYKKCLLISTAELMPRYSTLLGNSEVVSDMIINPVLATVIHKSCLVFLSGIIRTNFVIHYLQDKAEHQQLYATDSTYLTYFQRLCQFSSCLTRAAEYTISAISKISNRYYYAWRITKSQTIILRNITTPDFYKKNFDKGSHFYQTRYSERQLQELILICEETLSKFRNSSEFSTYGFAHTADATMNGGFCGKEGESSITPSAVTDYDVDKLWLEVISRKHDLVGGIDPPKDHRPMDTSKSNQTGDNFTQIPSLTTPQFNSSGIPDDPLGQDLGLGAKFDILSDVPFHEMFE